MKRDLALLSPVEIGMAGREWLATVPIDSAKLIDWCLELTLLHAGLADVLSLRGPSQQTPCRVSIIPVLAPQASSYAEYRENRLQLYLSADDLDYWQHFLLRCYRDQTASVDHLDLEIPLRNAAPAKALSLTVKLAGSLVRW